MKIFIVGSTGRVGKSLIKSSQQRTIKSMLGQEKLSKFLNMIM